jgi:tyrosine-protein phosphatase YwqE
MGIFSIFKKKEKFPPFDFSHFTCDIHSHLIPGIDDGSKSLQESIELLKEFEAMGYKKIITTPHIMSDYYKNTPEIILAGLDKVREEAEKQGLNIKIDAAAEYYLDEYFIKKIKSKELLTFGNNFVLFELPFVAEPQALSEVIFELQMGGYKPILAHPERYMYWFGNIDEKVEDLKNKGALLQLNLLSLTGQYSPEVKKVAEKMVYNNWINFVGSDCHKIEHLKILQNHSNTKAFHHLKQLEILNHQLI